MQKHTHTFGLPYIQALPTWSIAFYWTDEGSSNDDTWWGLGLDSIDVRVDPEKLSHIFPQWELGGSWRTRMPDKFFMVAQRGRFYLEGTISDNKTGKKKAKRQHHQYNQWEMAAHFLNEGVGKLPAGYNFSLIDNQAKHKANIKRSCPIPATDLGVAIKECGILHVRWV